MEELLADSNEESNLPANISSSLSGIPKALLPASIKALDRLIGAGMDIPVAWLAQQKAKIDARTQAFTLVEGAIAKAAASQAGGNEEIVQRAVDVLVCKAYRKQSNREAVATAMLEELSSNPEPSATSNSSSEVTEVDEDWLNVFERYAEDASTDRMQKLWGRVLAGEVRKSGSYAMRTLRFLSEFSQADALLFSDFCNNSFSDFAPKNLVKPTQSSDISALINMEASGLILGASGLGLKKSFTFNAQGRVFLREGDLFVMCVGEPHSNFAIETVILAPLGQELVSLLPGREPRNVAKKVAEAIKVPEIKEAFLGTVNGQMQFVPMDILWQEDHKMS
jgi:hypothetical protein